ncbi:hypothetical protein ACIQXM_17850 [Arthrobacter sp. NPDC097144]|uniref:hypothetical protein n=1 Tax=Arthrobacter sp. NPDC097144 TaxID=3363946 RepID=UPI0038232464
MSLATFWVKLPTSNLTSDGVNPSPTVSFLQSGLWYWTAALAVLAVIIGGARMAWEQRGDPIKHLVRSLLTLTLVSGMGLAVIAFLITAADGFSTWIINESTNGKGFASAIQNMIITGQADTAVFMVIIMGLLGIVTSIVQIVLMVIRSGMLVILAGILPTTAAFTNTEMGKQWFQKAIGWTLAFILYKPAAAIVYAAAFRLIDGGGLASSALLNSITGLALMVVALLALPALLRFVTPMVGAVASGGGGGGAAAMGAAAAAAMPSGARSLGSAGRGRGSMSPTPSSSSGEGSSSKSSPSGSSPTSSSGGVAAAARSTGGSKGTGAVVGSGSVSSGSSSGRVAAGGGAASGATAGAKAGAVAGPVGAAAGAAVSVAAKGQEAVKQVSDEAAGDGPSGSNN